jgi:hypothetical protein
MAFLSLALLITFQLARNGQILAAQTEIPEDQA